MKTLNDLSVVLVTLASISACTKTDPWKDTQMCEDVRRSIKETSPVQEARYNVHRGDRRFLATEGYALDFPGVLNYNLAHKNGYRILEKTSEEIEDESCLLYQSEAYSFAKIYNQEVIKLTRADNSRDNIPIASPKPGDAKNSASSRDAKAN